MVLATSVKERKEITGIQIGKEEVKLLLFADVMILYMDNPKDTHKELLELKHEFSKVAGGKIQESIVVLYTNNKLSER